jgi:c-di-GMP-binding flagellar brake protein YcgR
MSQAPDMLPIKQTEISVGKAVPWSIYDAQGQLLLASGAIVESQHQLDGLIRNGFASDSQWDEVRPAGQIMRAQVPVPTAKPESRPEPEPKDSLIDLDSVRWTVGETLHLQVHDDPNARYTVRMIGFVKNKSIHVSAPLLDGKVALIRDGQSFIVRAFPGKKAYAFTASALKSIYTPYPYLHLSYPKQVKCTVIRKGVRASVKIIAALALGTPERTSATTLNDLSMGGASCQSKVVAGTKGDTGTLKFKVNAAGNDEFLTLKVILRSITPSETGDGFRHGFEFLEVPTQAKLVLSAFVHQTLAESD